MQTFLDRLQVQVLGYLASVATARERLSLLLWQMQQAHALDDRDCYPGHLTTSAIVLSPDESRILLIDHVVIGCWLQPGGHYEAADFFWHSARREAVEETGVTGVILHEWHKGTDLPFVIDSHDVPGKKQRQEPDHVHHDLQYLFTADPACTLTAQLEEVHAADWKPVAMLAEISPKAWARLGTLQNTIPRQSWRR
jgi:8-oxo-dGTP pyrophosphatase MutT (NUDIX family)